MEYDEIRFKTFSISSRRISFHDFLDKKIIFFFPLIKLKIDNKKIDTDNLSLIWTMLCKYFFITSF
jgi:hypothetical protein